MFLLVNNFHQALGVVVFTFVLRPDVSPRMRDFVVVFKMSLMLSIHLFLGSFSGFVARTQFIICACRKLVVFHSHKISKLLYLLSFDVLNT